MLLLAIINEFPQLSITPTAPKTFEHVVFEAKLASYAAKLFHAFKRARPAIEILPDCAPGPDPFGIDSFRKQLWVWRWAKIWHDVAVHQSVQVGRNHHHTPGRDDGSRNRSRPGNTFDICFVAQFERMRDGMLVTENQVESLVSIGLEGHARVVCQRRFGNRSVACASWQFEG